MENPSSTPQSARGEATRELIVLAAERMFAEQGILAVALRDIGIAAGQKNSVAVQYHFGDRDTLLRAVASHRAAFVDRARVELLEELEQTGRAPTPEDYVRALVVPLARNVTEGNHYVPFLARYMVERGGYGGLETTVPTGTVDALTSLLRRVLPDVPSDLLDHRWEIVMTTAVTTLGQHQLSGRAGAAQLALDVVIEDLVRFLAAGLSAPPEDG